jgi:hypothetical protein
MSVKMLTAIKTSVVLHSVIKVSAIKLSAVVRCVI